MVRNLQLPITFEPNSDAQLRLQFYRLLISALLFFEGLSWLPYSAELFSSLGFQLPYFSFLNALPAQFSVLPSLCLIAGSAFLFANLPFQKVNVICLLIVCLWIFFLDRINPKVSSILMIHGLLIFAVWARPSAEASSPLPIYLLRTMFVQMYFFAGLVKWLEPTWRNGEAFLQILQGPWSTYLAFQLAAELPAWLAQTFSIAILCFEILIGPALLWQKTRWLAVIVVVTFHISIEFLLNVGFLSVHCIGAVLILFASEGFLRKVDGCLKLMRRSRF